MQTLLIKPQVAANIIAISSAMGGQKSKNNQQQKQSNQQSQIFASIKSGIIDVKA